jgi:hypothetical protein
MVALMGQPVVLQVDEKRQPKLACYQGFFGEVVRVDPLSRLCLVALAGGCKHVWVLHDCLVMRSIKDKDMGAPSL